MQQALLTSAEDTESPTKSTCVDIEKCSESAPRREQACRASLRGPVSILRVIGIPICDTDSKVPFYIICSSLWVLFFAMLIFAVIKPHSFTKAAVVANLVWLLHSTTIYTIVGVSMCSGADLLVLMADMASDNDDPKRATDITIDQSDMRKNAWMGSAYVYTGATANIIAVSIAFFNGYFYDFFPVIKSDFWLGFMIFMWVFYSVGSVLSVPFVYTPAMMLLRRVTKFVDLLEEKGEDLMGDFDRFSSW